MHFLRNIWKQHLLSFPSLGLPYWKMWYLRLSTVVNPKRCSSLLQSCDLLAWPRISSVKNHFKLAKSQFTTLWLWGKQVELQSGLKGYLKNCYFRAEILNLSNLYIVHNRLTIELILNAHNILQYKQDLQHWYEIAFAHVFYRNIFIFLYENIHWEHSLPDTYQR